jgi:hypothetical protein
MEYEKIQSSEEQFNECSDGIIRGATNVRLVMLLNAVETFHRTCN